MVDFDNFGFIYMPVTRSSMTRKGGSNEIQINALGLKVVIFSWFVLYTQILLSFFYLKYFFMRRVLCAFQGFEFQYKSTLRKILESTSQLLVILALTIALPQTT